MKPTVTLDQMMAFLDTNFKILQKQIEDVDLKSDKKIAELWYNTNQRFEELEAKIERLDTKNSNEHEEMKDMIQDVMGMLPRYQFAS